MKLAKRILLGAMAALTLVGCKDDPISSAPEASGRPDSNEPGVYFSLKIDLPNAAGSRSVTDKPGDNGSTSNSGVEIGQEYENTVNEAIIVLANASVTDKAVMNGFIAAASIKTGDLTALMQNHSSYKAQSMFSKGDLSSFYEKIGTENAESPDNIMANIFVFCNPTQNMKDQLLGNADVNIKAPEQNTNAWLMQYGSINSTSATGTTSIWWNNSFLMSNAVLATREIPGNTVGWNEYTSADNPFHLSELNKGGIDNGGNGRGSIKVERACARFDFRDGSQKGDFTYDVLSVEGDADEDGSLKSEVLIQVVLQKMFLVNQSKSFYYLPHVVDPVAADGSSIVGITTEKLKEGVCVPEYPWNFNDKGGYSTPYGNYVADYNLEWKNDVFNSWEASGDKSVNNFADYFNYPFFNSDGSIDNTDNSRWEPYLCSEVVKGHDDNPDSWNGAGNLPRYKIWCYTGENTIPSIEGQINSVSTGVVFKAKYSSPYPYTEGDLTGDNFIKRNNAMVAQAVNNTDDVSNDDPIIYMFSKVLYCGWENIQQAAIYAAGAEFVFNKTGEHPEVQPDGSTLIVPDGEWELKDGKINRTNSLYQAVFGKGGVGSITFKYHVEGDDKTYTATWDDPEEEDPNCANSAWKAWVAGGRPASGEVNDTFKEAVTDADITIYQRSYDDTFKEAGYYCYYYYWNRHNNNGVNGVMGPMEFAVVRNNVYKLAVTKINQLGHPRISENDPNKPGPRTPDEDESVYLDVVTEILPWVVRLNEIEF